MIFLMYRYQYFQQGLIHQESYLDFTPVCGVITFARFKYVAGIEIEY